MKKNKVLLMFALLAIISSVLFACSDDEKNVILEKKQKEIVFLKKDPIFLDLLKANIGRVDKIVNIEKAKTLIKKGDKNGFLSCNDLDELAISLGFDNTEDYKKYIIEEKIIIDKLNSNYNVKLRDIKREQLEEIVLQAMSSKLKTSASNCERIRQDCLLTAAAGAVAGHCACATVDAIGIGIICHAAVLVAQAAASDKCNAEAEDCNR